MSNSMDTWLSNVHVVIESRWQASVGKEVHKARFCIDYSKMANKHLNNHSYPLPLMDEYRRQLSKYRYFLNLDACSFYFQLLLDNKSKDATGLHALGNMYKFKCLAMGITPAVEWTQSIKHHLQCTPFIQDLNLGSGTKKDHMKKDLPNKSELLLKSI